MAKRGGTYVKRGAWAAPASSWAFSPFFSHSPPLFNGRSNTSGRGGEWGGARTGTKPGPPGEPPAGAGFPSPPGERGLQPASPEPPRRVLSPRAPFLPPLPPSRPCTWLVPARRVPRRPGPRSRRAPCGAEGCGGSAEGCARRPLTDTNAGSKGSGGGARGAPAGGGRQRGHAHTHTEPGGRAHARARGRAKGKVPPCPAGRAEDALLRSRTHSLLAEREGGEGKEV